jgi:protein-tyrosine-phosphatase
LNEFVEAVEEVADPFGQSMDAYEKTFQQLSKYIERALKKIRQESQE